MDYLKHLPVELKCQIFSYLPAEDVLQCLFLSRYFYETIRYGSGAFPSIDVPILKNGNCLFYPNDTNFCLSVITNNRTKLIHGLRIVEYFATYDEIEYFLSNYNIKRLHLSETGSIVLRAIRQLGPFNNLCELRFGFEMPLDVNNLKVLADFTPNLEVLKIDFYYGLRSILYNGEVDFTKLKSLRISTDSFVELDDYFGEGVLSPDFIISSFLKRTPNLNKLALLGLFFEKKFRPTITFVQLLNNLDSLAIEISDEFYISGVPPIKQGSTKLTELYIKCRKNSFTLPQESPLVEIETLYFDGSKCGQFLGYYGIGENLKNLYLRPFGDLEDVLYFLDELKDLCRGCGKLESLVVLSRSIPVSWLKEVASDICKRLKTVSFYSFARQKDGYNVELLTDIDHLRNIYLYERLPQSDINILLERFNVIHGAYYEFDVFDKNPFGEKNLFLTK